MAGDDKIRIKIGDDFQQQFIRLGLSQIADAQRAVKGGHIPVAEIKYEMIILDQTVGKFLCPVNSGFAETLNLLIGNVKDSHTCQSSLSSWGWQVYRRFSGASPAVAGRHSPSPRSDGASGTPRVRG